MENKTAIVHKLYEEDKNLEEENPKENPHRETLSNLYRARRHLDIFTFTLHKRLILTSYSHISLLFDIYMNDAGISNAMLMSVKVQ